MLTISCLCEFLAVIGCIGGLLLIAWIVRDGCSPFRNPTLSAEEEHGRPIREPVYGLGLVPGTDLLACYGRGGAIHLYNQQTGELIDRLDLPNNQLTTLDASPDGRQILAGYTDGAAVLWTIAEGSVRMQKLLQCDAMVRDVAFAHSGRWVAIADMKSGVQIWDLKTRQVLHSPVTREGLSHIVRFTSDDRYLVSGGGDGAIRFWNSRTGEEVRRLTGHTAMVSALAISPDDQMIVSCSLDRTIRAWDVANARELWQANGASQMHRPVVFSPDGSLLATARENLHIDLRDRKTGQEMAILSGHTSELRDLEFAADGHTLYSCGIDGTIRCWDMESRSPLWTTHWEPRW